MSVCSAVPSDAPLLAVLGIFTAEHAKNALHRREARKTWLSTKFRSPWMDVVFVARGLGASKDLISEARTHGDVVFVNASATLGRAQGPLATLLSWLVCVTRTAPNAQLIGKADDDTMLMLPGIAAHLRGSLAELQRLAGPAPRMLWGLQESYHWDPVTHRPDGFDDAFGYKRNCMKQNRQLEKTKPLGPFNFAKGACLFLSTSLATQLVAAPHVRAEFSAASAAAVDNSASMRAAISNLENSEAMPWEDVLLGYSLATGVVEELGPAEVGGKGDGKAFGSGRSANLAFVHAGRAIYAEEWYTHGAGLGLAPSTLIMHNRGKRPTRISRAHRWARKHHCQARRVKLECLPLIYTSCAGAHWRRCTASTQPLVEAQCSTAIQMNLSSRAAPSHACTQDASARFTARLDDASTGPGRVRRRPSKNAATSLAGLLTSKPMRGHCGETEFGDSDCVNDDSGAWKISRSLTNGTLLECMARCACCERCRYVSFSPQADDCSWYHDCDRLTRKGAAPDTALDRDVVSVPVPK